jgi:hypothetical protein
VHIYLFLIGSLLLQIGCHRNERILDYLRLKATNKVISSSILASVNYVEWETKKRIFFVPNALQIRTLEYPFLLTLRVSFALKCSVLSG